MTDYINVCRTAVAESFDDGYEKGCYERNVEMALDMLADNEPLEKIVKYSHLPKEKVLELRDSQTVFKAK